MVFTLNEAHIIGHTLGINVYHARNSKRKADRKLPMDFYRNRFCTSAGHGDLPIIERLVTSGYMAQSRTINNGESILWYVTKEGEAQFRQDWEQILSAQ